MKKMLLGVVALTFVFACLAACGGEKKTETPPATPPAEAPK